MSDARPLQQAEAGAEAPRNITRQIADNIRDSILNGELKIDERLSTVAAERALLEMDVSRKKRVGRIDSAAAAFILQGVLDRIHALR